MPHPSTSLVGFSDSQNPPSLKFLEELQQNLRPRMVASLLSRGASAAMAEDVASEILAECLSDSDANLLRNFRGQSGLDFWLLRVAINRLITLQRRERFTVPLNGDIEPEAAADHKDGLEFPLRDLVSRALRQAIGTLPAGLRLLLWLRYGHGISQKRLCVCWRCSPTKLSRMLAAARIQLKERTLREIRREEPGLLLAWEDISEVCAGSGFMFE